MAKKESRDRPLVRWFTFTESFQSFWNTNGLTSIMVALFGITTGLVAKANEYIMPFGALGYLGTGTLAALFAAIIFLLIQIGRGKAGFSNERARTMASRSFSDFRETNWEGADCYPSNHDFESLVQFPKKIIAGCRIQIRDPIIQYQDGSGIEMIFTTSIPNNATRSLNIVFSNPIHEEKYKVSVCWIKEDGTKETLPDDSPKVRTPHFLQLNYISVTNHIKTSQLEVLVYEPRDKK